jgi:hypothetical protein
LESVNLFLPILKMNRNFHFEIKDEKKFINDFEKNLFINISAEDIWDLGYETKPQCEYEKPASFPLCCGYHKSLKNQIDTWFENFPDCCESHKKLKQKQWFSKEKYISIADKIIIQIDYTTNFISKNINTSNWYKDITDYIDYSLESYGTPNVGANQYFLSMKDWIKKDNENIYINENSWKKNQLLEFLESKTTNNTKIKKETDLNLLQSTFQKWVKSLPDILIFSDYKKEYIGKFPIDLFLHDGEYNRFTQLTKYKSRTKSELIEILIKQTQSILEFLTSKNSYQTGDMSFKTKYEIDIISEKHELSQKQLLTDYSKQEIHYVKILKKWLANEKTFINEIKPLITDNQRNILTLNNYEDVANFYNQVIDEIFYFGQNLEKYKNLYDKFDEEGFRDYFLPHLNLISKNHCATGETFNKIGKTDILIQNKNGQNIFIAECKIWKGVSEFNGAIDQLLSRYVTWRDEKVALIFFNKKNKNFSNIIKIAREKIKEHPLYFEEIGERHPTSFKYIFKNNEDQEKKLNLELIIFNCS